MSARFIHHISLLILLLAVIVIAVSLTGCTSPAERQQEQQATVLQQSLTLRIIDLIAADKL